MSVFITGVAGFIGCNLARFLLNRGQRVAGFDNLCRGQLQNLNSVIGNPDFTFKKIDLADLDSYREALTRLHERSPISVVWHMAANSDIPAGVTDAWVDLRDTFMTTFNTLEVMKHLNIPTLAFASTSAVYGDLQDIKLTEDSGPLFPISNYGAMKLASEAIISAAVESFLERAYIFRFPNVIGTPATHGALLDFVHKLNKTPNHLVVLGDGTQQKPYLHVDELIDAMLYIYEQATERLNYFNIGADDEGVTVKFMAEQVVATVSPGATITYGEGSKGWVGDVPRFFYSIEKLRRLGWKPTLGSAAAVRLAVRQIAAQEAIK
jgi:UDP-glucose 4-epimerase